MPGGETVSFEMAPVIAEAIRQTRTEALEEAAKIAETIESGPFYWADGRPNAGVVIGGQHIAAAIREKAKA